MFRCAGSHIDSALKKPHQTTCEITDDLVIDGMLRAKDALWREEDQVEFWNKIYHSQHSWHTRPVKQLAIQDRKAPIDIAVTELIYGSRYSYKSPKSSQERADNKGSYHQGTLRNS